MQGKTPHHLHHLPLGMMQMKRCRMMKQTKGGIMKNFNPSPMAASSLLAELRAAGFTLAADGSRLRVAPADSLTDELRAAIREHRAGLVRILAAETAPAAESYPSPTQAEKMPPRANLAPSRVFCGGCSHFLPDTINPAQGVGRCGVTGTGPPPGGSGYSACYPFSPRTCSHFQPLKESNHD